MLVSIASPVTDKQVNVCRQCDDAGVVRLGRRRRRRRRRRFLQRLESL